MIRTEAVVVAQNRHEEAARGVRIAGEARFAAALRRNPRRRRITNTLDVPVPELFMVVAACIMHILPRPYHLISTSKT